MVEFMRWVSVYQTLGTEKKIMPAVPSKYGVVRRLRVWGGGGEEVHVEPCEKCYR